MASLVDHQPGGQKRSSIGTLGRREGSRSFVTGSVTAQMEQAADAAGLRPSASDREPCVPKIGGCKKRIERTRRHPVAGQADCSRPMKYGLRTRFESHREDSEFSRVIESTGVVKQGHVAYRPVVVLRSEGGHNALCVTLMLTGSAAVPNETQAFVTMFLTRRGETLDGLSAGSRGRR